MQSSGSRRETSNISLGERRGKSDLARFSLDLSWARAATESARLRAYPSPPMSGSPPNPPSLNLDSSDRGHGNYGSSGQIVYQGTQTSQSEHSEHRSQGVAAYPPEQGHPTSFAPFRLDMPQGQMQYQQQPFMTPQQQHQAFPQHAQHPQQAAAGFRTPEGAPTRDVPEYISPKNQRKTKGHVASACVPCKRAHLRCDAQRPCSRCLSNGKEDTCVDVQHKKRGRPRLRDERDARYETMGSGFVHPAESSMRRPVPFYGPGEGSATPFGYSVQRSGSYRVLKSQGQGQVSMGGPLAPRFIDQALQDANIYAPPQPAPRILTSQEPICAYLNMEMQFAKVTQSFAEIVGIQPIVSRKLQDVVVGTDVEKVMRQQRSLDDERREKEPNYLPPIYHKFEEDRVIQAVGFGPDELGQIRRDRQEMLTFQGPDGQQRSFQVRLGLGKKESTYFVALVLHLQTPQQAFHTPSQSPYMREVYPREHQYSFQPQPQPYMQNPSPTAYGSIQGFDSSMTGFRPPGHMGGSGPPTSAPIQGFAQPPRQEYAQPQGHYQSPQGQQQYQPAPPPGSGEMAMHPGQVQRQRDLQLPPIRDPRAEILPGPARHREDRTGRVDIGGLIEKPDMARRGH